MGSLYVKQLLNEGGEMQYLGYGLVLNLDDEDLRVGDEISYTACSGCKLGDYYDVDDVCTCGGCYSVYYTKIKKIRSLSEEEKKLHEEIVILSQKLKVLKDKYHESIHKENQ